MGPCLHHLLAAAILPCVQVVSSQSIFISGRPVAADLSNISPAYETVPNKGDSPEAYQLTDSVIANLTQLQLTNATLFGFTGGSYPQASTCKVMPTDNAWPTEETWNTLNLLTGGNLINTVPIGAVCYQGEHYNAAQCQKLTDNWSDSSMHTGDPTSVMWPLFQGATCLPQNAAKGTCELGGYPVHSVKVTKVSDVQLAMNFARNTGVRLVIRNTGHDFLGKSTGAGSLSIWTHNLKDIDFIPAYSSPSSSYTGTAIKMGAGVEGIELYEAANKFGVTALSGEGRTVGVAGGYTAGGGLSPMTGKYGLAADQVLSIDVVTPDGRFQTADETNNADLFWALRGGGGATFGVVTSMTVKVYPKMVFSGMTFEITSGSGGPISNDVMFAALKAYFRQFPGFADAGSYAYATLFPAGDDSFTWTMSPWIIPGMKIDEFKSLVAPLLAEWKQVGFPVEPAFFEHDNFLETYNTHFPTDVVGNPTVRTASRLFPKENWVNPSLLTDTMSFIEEIVREGSSLIFYCVNGAAPDGTPASAVTPAWRSAYMFAIIGTIWDVDASPAEVERINVKITGDWTERLRSLTPGGGTYLNEADVMDPQFKDAFYGYDNYLRLLDIKKRVDPYGVLWAPTAVGSDAWYVTGQQSWLTLQTGQLCYNDTAGAAQKLVSFGV